MLTDTLTYTRIDTDTHFSVEVSPRGEDSWAAMDNRTFDTWIVALSALQRHVASVRDEDETEYRIVRKIVTSDVVTHT